jgi:hypothetical protein
VLYNINTLNDSYQTLKCYDTKSCLNIHDSNQITIDICLRGIKIAHLCIKRGIARQAHAKDQYQHILASDIIDRKYRHLSPEHSLSDKLEREDLIDKKLKHMSKANARSNLFKMLKFDIKGLIDPDSIKHNALARVDATVNGCITHLTTKM